jgi:hypothetical protein
VRIYAINGAVLYERKYENAVGDIKVDLSKLPAGNYFIHYFSKAELSRGLAVCYAIIYHMLKLF